MIVTMWYRMVERRSKNKYERLLEYNHFSEGWNDDEFHPTPIDPSFKSQASWKSGDWYKRKGWLLPGNPMSPFLSRTEKDIYYLNKKPFSG